MIWNPTSNRDFPYDYTMGGKHFVYVFGGNSVKSKFYITTLSPSVWEPSLDGYEYGVGRYDYGKQIITTLKKFFTTDVFNDQMAGERLAPFNAVERDIMWVSIPMPRAGFDFKDPADMPSDVRFQINVAKPYRYGFSGIANIPQGGQPYASTNKLVSVNTPSLLTTDIRPASEAQNGNFPMYTFNTSDIAALFNQSDISKSALDLIKVVPNPYYGSSSYESLNRTDNRVRITNLPSKCTIKIYTMNGVLVRTFKRDVSGQEDLYVANVGGNDIRQSQRISYLDWDLKNQNNITVASGLYIFHIDAPGVGEKVVKWFGVMRPLDVQNY
jgi:hypothetical protein